MKPQIVILTEAEYKTHIFKAYTIGKIEALNNVLKIIDNEIKLYTIEENK